MPRSVLARSRAVGLLEFASLFGPLAVVLIVIDLVKGVPIQWGDSNDVLQVVAMLAPAFVIRFAVASEYVEADAEGLWWRTLFRRRFIPWRRIEEIGIGQMWLFSGSPSSSYDVIRVKLRTGGILRLRASVWNSARARRWLTALADVVPAGSDITIIVVYE